MPNIEGQIKALRRRIDNAARAADRAPADIRLVAVSKTFPAAAVIEARRCGIGDFGENYAQEAEAKIAAVAARGGGVIWHFVGAIQKNKAKIIAAKFDWAHAIDNLALAEKLSRARGATGLPPLQICLQVNIDGEKSKAGVAPAAAAAAGLARAVCGLPHLRLRGLTAIPAPRETDAAQRAAFRAVADLRRQIAATGIELDSLSMGMSDDFAAAIAEGATMIRIGRGIFGARPPKTARPEATEK